MLSNKFASPCTLCTAHILSLYLSYGISTTNIYKKRVYALCKHTNTTSTNKNHLLAHTATVQPCIQFSSPVILIECCSLIVLLLIFSMYFVYSLMHLFIRHFNTKSVQLCTQFKSSLKANLQI